MDTSDSPKREQMRLEHGDVGLRPILYAIFDEVDEDGNDAISEEEMEHYIECYCEWAESSDVSNNLNILDT